MLSVHDLPSIERTFAQDDTKLVLFEAPTNPMLQVPDLEAIVALAKQHDVITVLDNTFAGLHNHGRYGIDYFVHSMTKYANGHGDVMGGIVIGDKKRIRAIKPLAVNMGSTLDPGAAFMVLRGLKTYYLRYERHSANALAIAEYLGTRREVETVFYPGLAERSGPRARAQADERLRRRAELRPTRDQEQTWAFIDALELFVTTASLGSTESLVSPGEAVPRQRSQRRGAGARGDQGVDRPARRRDRARRRPRRRPRPSAAQDLRLTFTARTPSA